MQPETTLEELIGQLRSSSVAFGTDNPVNGGLRRGLEGALDSPEAQMIDPAAVIVLEQTPKQVADLRDLAQDVANQTDFDTVLVRTPHVAVGVSDDLTRAQIESGQLEMVSEPDYVAGLHAFVAGVDSFSVNWPLVVGLVVALLACVAVVTVRLTRR